MSRCINLIGQKFDRLEVLKRVDNAKDGHTRWLCSCVCENEVIVWGKHLKNGHTKSCGCLRKELAVQRWLKHGYYVEGKEFKVYQVWADMIARCTNPNHNAWKDYGGRGITVCEKWLKFENFNKDMGNKWKPGLTIERKENNQGYNKENCEWATRKKQMRNTRDNLYVTYNNKTQLLIEWSEKTRIPYKILWDRIYKLGWSPEKALTTLMKNIKNLE